MRSTSQQVPYVRLPENGDFASASSLQVPRLVVMDGARIGLPDMVDGYGNEAWFTSISSCGVYFIRRQVLEKTNRTLDQATWTNFDNSITAFEQSPEVPCDTKVTFGIPLDSNCYDGHGYTSSACFFSTIVTCVHDSECEVVFSDWPTEYSAPVTSKITILGKRWSLPDPPLSIVVNGSGFGKYFYSIGSRALKTSYITSTGQCEPSKTYVWGFSFPMLFTVCILTMLFFGALGFVYLDTYNNGEADQFERPVSIYRDILDLAHDIKQVLGNDGDTLSTKELERKFGEDTTRIRLETDSLIPSRYEQKQTRRRMVAV